MPSKLNFQYARRSALVAIVLTLIGSGALQARPEMDPCGRSYPQVTDKYCEVVEAVSVDRDEPQVRALSAASEVPLQPAGDMRATWNNRGRQ